MRRPLRLVIHVVQTTMLENKGRLGQDKQRNLPFAIRWDALGQRKQKGHIICHFHIDHNAPCLPPAIKKIA